MAYQFFPKSIRDSMPPLYSQEQVRDPIVHVKFFTPWANWTWYGTEFDGEDTFFGWVVGFEKELGYFSLSEMESARGPAGLKIERDIHFEPKPLSQVMADYGERMPSVERKPQKPRELPTFKGYTVDYRLREFRKAKVDKKLEFISFDSPRGQELLKEMGQSRVPQTEHICPICGGPGMSMGILGRKHWFRCRDCGMQWSIDAKRSSRLPSVHLYATPARQLMDDLEKYWKAGNTDEFYRLLEQVKKAIKERERGKIKLMPDISLTELRDIKNQADRLYR